MKEVSRSDWKPLYRLGGMAALLAAVLFRRNIGAEVSLFTGVYAVPENSEGWFALLQDKPLFGLNLLAVFDLLNYILVGLMFVVLAVLLGKERKSLVAVALASGTVGILLQFLVNISLSMFSLSQLYAATESETLRADLLDAGQTLLAINNTSSAMPSTGAFLGILFVALASLLFSLLLLSTHRVTGIMGIIASSLDLAYCLLIFFLPPIFPTYLLLAAAGLFWMIWHFLVGIVQIKAGKAMESG